MPDTYLRTVDSDNTPSPVTIGLGDPRAASGGVLSDGTSTGRTYFYVKRVANAARDIRLVYYIPSTAPNPVNIKASLYVYGAGLTPVFFGGKRTTRIEPGGFIHSDPVPITFSNSNASAFRELGVLTYVSVDTSGQKWPLGLQMNIGGTQFGSINEGAGAGDLTDALTNSKPQTTADSNYGFGPILVTGVPVGGSVKGRSLLGIGDSILFGYQDSIIPGGWLVRSINALPQYAAPYTTPSAAYVNLGFPGQTSGAFSGDQIYMAKGSDRAVVAYGVNEVQGNFSLSQIQAGLERVRQQLKDLNIQKLALCTLTPLPNATTAQANVRSSVNDWLRSGPTNWDVVVPVASVVETAVNSNAYGTNFDSGDHIHPSSAGHTAIAADTNVKSAIASLLAA